MRLCSRERDPCGIHIVTYTSGNGKKKKLNLFIPYVSTVLCLAVTVVSPFSCYYFCVSVWVHVCVLYVHMCVEAIEQLQHLLL